MYICSACNESPPLCMPNESDSSNTPIPWSGPVETALFLGLPLNDFDDNKHGLNNRPNNYDIHMYVCIWYYIPFRFVVTNNHKVSITIITLTQSGLRNRNGPDYSSGQGQTKGTTTLYSEQHFARI